jgi:hypothetical protein
VSITLGVIAEADWVIERVAFSCRQREADSGAVTLIQRFGSAANLRPAGPCAASLTCA